MKDKAYNLLKAAKLLQAAAAIASQSHALYVKQKANTITLVLYDVEALAKVLANKRIRDLEQAFADQVIVGTLAAEQNKQLDAWEVFRVAAKDGLGPWLHDALLALAGNHTIVPDQHHITVPEVKVWIFYDLKRPDVIKMPFEGPNVTPSLNKRYQKLHNNIDVTPFVQKHVADVDVVSLSAAALLFFDGMRK